MTHPLRRLFGYATPYRGRLVAAVAGMLVVLSVLFFDKIQIDDPVGALSVHLTNGIWGTLSIGLFASQATPGGIDADGLFYGGGFGLLMNQFIGVLAVGAFTFGFALVVWGILKAVGGIRVSAEDEYRGLDMSEMGMEAYAKDSVSHMP